MLSHPQRLTAVLTIVLTAVVGLHIGLPGAALADGTTENGGSDPPNPPGGITLPSGPLSSVLDSLTRIVPRMVRLAMI